MISSRDLNAPTTQPRKCRSHTIMPRILPRSARALGVKSEQLLTQGMIFEDDILAGPECTNNPAEEVPEPYDHAQNLTEIGEGAGREERATADAGHDFRG